MVYNFTLNKRKRKDGRFNVQIKLQHGSTFRKYITTDINVLGKHFNARKTIFKCKNTHPGYEQMNFKINDWRNRCEEAYNFWSAGTFTLRQVYEYIKNNLSTKSVDEYVESYMKKNMTEQTYWNYSSKLKTIKSHLKINRPLEWKEFNRDFYDDLLHKLENSKNKRGEPISNYTIKSYATALSGILNHAKERGIIYHFHPLPKILKTGGRKRGINKSRRIKITSSQQMIERVQSIKNLAQWEAFTMWHLCFCLRGFYPADLVKITEEELDDPNQVKFISNEIYLYHLRSKTQNTENKHLYIHLDNQIVIPLLSAFKRVVAYRMSEKYKDKIAHVNDSIKILDYDPTNERYLHYKLTRKNFKVLSNFGMDFKSPRKTFHEVARSIEFMDNKAPVKFSEELRLLLLGRLSDPILAKSYTDEQNVHMREVINKAHSYVLKKFDAQLITNLLQFKLIELLKKSKNKYPYWIGYQPCFTINGLYERMSIKRLKGLENEKILVDKPNLKFYAYGNKIKSGIFNCYTKIQEKKIDIFPVEKEFEWYWKDFVSSGNRFHPGSLQEVIDWDYRKTLLKEDKSQIIRLPRSIKNKLNFEELIKN